MLDYLRYSNIDNVINNKQIYLGESKYIEKAKRLRLDAEKKYFGEFGSARN